jgi:hypothetical protein
MSTIGCNHHEKLLAPLRAGKRKDLFLLPFPPLTGRVSAVQMSRVVRLSSRCRRAAAWRGRGLSTGGAVEGVPPTGMPPSVPRPTTGQRKKMSVLDLLHMKRRGQRITMVTAYDYPSVSEAVGERSELAF